MKKVLITDDVHPSLIDGLEQLGYSCVYQPDISLDETTSSVRDFDGIVIKSKIRATRSFLEKAPNLSWIGRLGSGLDIIDLDAAEELGIGVISAPEGNCNAVAEHAMAMLLSLMNRINRGDMEVRKFDWQREANRGIELAGRTVGIIGYGHTGPAFAKKLAGFDVNVLVYDKFKKHLQVDQPYIQVCDLATIQREAEVISLHVSLNPTSHHLVNAAFVDACAQPIILINTSRGESVVTEDLIAGLQSQKILGACLDVYENEKPSSFSDYEKELYSSLYSFNNVVLTPHVAGWTKESKERIARTLVMKIGAWKG